MNEREHHETEREARKQLRSRPDRPGRYADVAERLIRASLYSGIAPTGWSTGDPSTGDPQGDDEAESSRGGPGDSRETGEDPRAAAEGASKTGN